MASMPPIASEEPASPRYGFSFAWESPYGHAVELLERLRLQRGVVIDLGCGVGSIAEPLLDAGHQYAGADIDAMSLEHVSKRGLEAHQLDLTNTAELAVRMKDLANGRHVAAVLLLDVIEHLTDTRAFLSALREGLEALGRPPRS